MNDRVDEAFAVVSRRDFLPASQVAFASEDRPLPIGEGQTNSQPSTVRRMLKWLDVQPGNKVLDVGSGSGWTSALLGKLTGPMGRVCATEIIPELLEFGRGNCAKYALENVTFHAPEAYGGLSGHAPYDRILVSASWPGEIPRELINQLTPGGKLIIPIQQSIVEVTKTPRGVTMQQHYGFAFVPLIAPER